MAQQLQETTDRAIAAYNLAAQAFGAIVPVLAGSNIDITYTDQGSIVSLKNPMNEDVVINADLTVNGDIYQNGSAYESHAEQLYTTKDTVIMRDGATTGLAPGDVAGLIMKKYDGTNDGALVVSNDGTARVGDVGSEQPLMTRDESGSMINGELLQWNATGEKAVCSGVNLSQIVRGTGNIGSDTQPVKVVGGVATAVTNELQTKLTSTAQVLTPRNDITGITITNRDGATGCRLITYGSIAILNISVTVSGTRSGSSGWYSLFPNLDLSNYYIPYSVGQTPAELSEGYKLYFANGTSYNYTLNTQVIFIHK